MANNSREDTADFEFVPKLMEAHFFSLPSQGNAYCLKIFEDSKGSVKIIVASLKHKIFCIEYTNARPCIKNVLLSCIPGGSDIGAIDLMELPASNYKMQCLLGVTIVKGDDTEGEPSQFLNIYSDWQFSTDDNGSETDALGCSSVELMFIPYFLFHTTVKHEGNTEFVWLLTGGDFKVHEYRANNTKFLTSTTYVEIDIQPHFPELAELCDLTLCLDIRESFDCNYRTTAVCSESGVMQAFKVDLSTMGIVASHRVSWDYPVSCVRIFSVDTFVPVPEELSVTELCKQEAELELFLLVATSLESCFVYSDIFNECRCNVLNESDTNDVVTGCIVCDFDFDGVNEIVIGTYGQVLMVYKCSDEKWCLQQTISLAHPILSLESCDVISDGSRQLIVLTTGGVHIFQNNPWQAKDLLMSRLSLLASGLVEPQES